MTRRTVGVLMFSSLLFGQQEASPTSWRGLQLDSATPEAAVEILGAAATDRVEKAQIYPNDRLFMPELKSRGLRCLLFKQVPGFREVRLFFLEDKLALIQLQNSSTILPSALPNIYGINFQPIVGGFIEAMEGRKRQNGKVDLTTYPSYYTLTGSDKQAVINAYVKNDGVMSSLFKSRDSADSGFPGKVALIQLISRRLENRTGTDLLK